MDSVTLSSYLDVLAQPSVVLDLSAVGAESAKVCYVNPTFAQLFSGDQETSNDAFAGQLFVDVLQLRLISPHTTTFLQWIKEIIAENTLTPLRSQFKGNTKSISIKWTGVLIQNTYIVLTGRISSPSNLPSPERSSRHAVATLRCEDISPPPSSTDSSSPPLNRVTSPPGFSRQNSSNDTRLKANTKGEPQTTWRNTEKVIFTMRKH